mgnify:CR=1 FL=1
MGRHEIIELAMQLEPAERFEVAEELLRSVAQNVLGTLKLPYGEHVVDL